MSTITYGRALFYPHINFNDDKWIKTAALYYTGLNRILPEGYDAHDSDVIKYLNQDDEFIKNINPTYQAEHIAEDFIIFVKDQLIDKDNRDRLMQKIGVLIPNAGTFSIHMSKIGEKVKLELPALNLATKNSIRGMEDWYEFEPATGALYMTFLANYLATIDHVPVVTDEPFFQSVLKVVQNDKYKSKNDLGAMLASIVIQSVVPDKIEKIPIKKIVKFRKEFVLHRVSFYNEINKLVKDLENVDNQNVLNDILQIRKTEIEKSANEMKVLFSALKIDTVTTLLGLSIPSFASNSSPMVALAGLLTIAIGKVLTKKGDYYRSKSASPYSYVLSLKNSLKSETFVEQLLHGKVML